METNLRPAIVPGNAHYGVALTWDYFRTTHARSGIANDGAGARSRVHYGSRYNNALWSDSCLCMIFGDGDGSTFTPLVSVDVAGHDDDPRRDQPACAIGVFGPIGRFERSYFRQPGHDGGVLRQQQRAAG
ncbi:Zinc metalloprotease [Xanthomonas fragariae]|uniref:Transglutaminase-activating metalloprotease n=1 Tax=Xanthomonas fragariae TaxID=48664 RepID=A0A1Y6H4W9_9XANT|nr:Zinc metalloprotease [Xanthomonas fragariae]SMQ97551.1 Transglutaminase-activating metalloprotease precursor [Xanthomonas fragariae]SMR04987.1 Zinc metalloprotease [Xanthomonas fragariae]